MFHQKLTHFTLLLFLLACSAFAQTADKRIDEIDHLYEQTNEAIRVAEENAPYSEKYVVEIAVNKTGNAYPAVGNYTNVTRFHYTFGDRDQIAPLAQGRLLASRIPGARFVQLELFRALKALGKPVSLYVEPGGGHSPNAPLPPRINQLGLTFSGGVVIRLEVECLEAELADLGPTWTTATCPAHADGELTGAPPRPAR